MPYLKAEEHLPSELIKEIQKYISGAQIYIPGIAENRLHWGEKNGTRKILENRNKTIRNLKKSCSISICFKKFAGSFFCFNFFGKINCIPVNSFIRIFENIYISFGKLPSVFPFPGI